MSILCHFPAVPGHRSIERMYDVYTSELPDAERVLLSSYILVHIEAPLNRHWQACSSRGKDFWVWVATFLK